MTKNSNSTVVKVLGRPKCSDSLVFFTVGLSQSQWEWLQLWFPTGSKTDSLRSLLDRAMKFWPCGPYVFGHARKTGGEL